MNRELKCIKCGRDVPVVVTRVNDAFCQDCFLSYAVHKFRSAIGKSRVILPKEHVLVAYSGGLASSAVLHFIQEGITEGKLRFTVSVIHIDELGAVCGPQGEADRDRLQKIRQLVTAKGFPFFLANLQQAVEMCPDKQNADSSVLLCEEVMPEAQEVMPEANSKLTIAAQSRLQKLLDTLSTSSQQQMIRILRHQLLVAVARQHGFSKVVLGDTATSLSVRIMTDIANGRGAQVTFDSNIADRRHGDVILVRPLRDLNLKEVEAYNRLQNVASVDLPPNQNCGVNSMEKLTATFVQNLQQGFPSTVANIVRTSDKLSQQAEMLESCKCVMCQSPLDTDVREASALRAVEFCEGLSQAPGNHWQRIPLPVLDDVRKCLCYGCRLMVKDLREMALLPQYVLQASRLQDQ